jgi:hypothetical protein
MRPLRIELAGGLHHVIVRGNERKADTDRSRFLEVLGSVVERGAVGASCLLFHG